MKATELMIMDWCLHEGEPHQIRQLGIFGENRDGEDYPAVCIGKPNGVGLIVERNKIEPIPLTPEILEKNGFYYGYTSSEEDLASNTIAQLSEEDKGWVWDKGNGEIKVIFPNESDSGMITINDQGFDRRIVFIFSENIYVHELQHVLRLCGIKKEIKL